MSRGSHTLSVTHAQMRRVSPTSSTQAIPSGQTTSSSHGRTHDPDVCSSADQHSATAVPLEGAGHGAPPTSHTTAHEHVLHLGPSQSDAFPDASVCHIEPPQSACVDPPLGGQKTSKSALPPS